MGNFKPMNHRESMLPTKLKTSALSGAAPSIDHRHALATARLEARELPRLGPREEALVVDGRSELRPAQVIESKLANMLRNSSLPSSLLLTRTILRAR